MTDRATGLQWEQKTTDVGTGPNFADPHDVDNFYDWSASGTAPDGTVFTDFLAALNTPPCFAGHCDWRLPQSGGKQWAESGELAELESIYHSSAQCEVGGCVNPIFGPTRGAPYWSATSHAGLPGFAWAVYFDDGSSQRDNKQNDAFVRAVRGTSILPPVPSPTPCTPFSSGRFVDNCNGTVTDTQTGLQWEQKTTALGSGENYRDPRDVDNEYSWTKERIFQIWNGDEDGTVFTDFLEQLNTPPCFASQCDWRLPELSQLLALRLAPYPCSPDPCIDPIFGPVSTEVHFWRDPGYWTDFAGFDHLHPRARRIPVPAEGSWTTATESFWTPRAASNGSRSTRAPRVG